MEVVLASRETTDEDVTNIRSKKVVCSFATNSYKLVN